MKPLRIKIKRENFIFKNWIIIILLLLPIFIIDFFKPLLLKSVVIFGNNKYTPVLIFTFILVLLYYFFSDKRKNKSIVNNQLKILLLFTLYLLSHKFIGLTNNHWVRVIEIILPILTSLIMLKIIIINPKNVKWFINVILLLFFIYTMLFIFHWYFKTRHAFDIDPTLGFARFRTAYTGSVTFGQLLATIPLVFVLSIKRNNFLTHFIVILFCFILIYITGTRSAVWALLIALIIILLLNIKSSIRLVSSMAFLISILIFLISITNVKYDRFVTKSNSRQLSQIEAINSSLSSVESIFVGKGLSNFFPYERYYKSSQSSEFNDRSVENIFYYENKEILVEPHSTFVWIFVETGLIGLILFFALLLRPIKVSLVVLKNIKIFDNYLIGLSLFCVITCLTNFMGSFLINEPYVSVLCWFLFFITESYYFEVFKNEKSIHRL